MPNPPPQKNDPPKNLPLKFFFLKSIFKDVLGSVDAKKAPPPKKKNDPSKNLPPKFFFLKSIFKDVLGSVDANPPPKKKMTLQKIYPISNFFS